MIIYRLSREQRYNSFKAWGDNLGSFFFSGDRQRRRTLSLEKILEWEKNYLGLGEGNSKGGRGEKYNLG